jgi:hypothetical protein
MRRIAPGFRHVPSERARGLGAGRFFNAKTQRRNERGALLLRSASGRHNILGRMSSHRLIEESIDVEAPYIQFFTARCRPGADRF